MAQSKQQETLGSHHDNINNNNNNRSEDKPPSPSPTSTSTSIWTLPPELRFQIYTESLSTFHLNTTSNAHYFSAGQAIEPPLLASHPQIRSEAIKIYYKRLITLSSETHKEHLAAHESLIDLLVHKDGAKPAPGPGNMDAVKVCKAARELDEVHEKLQRTRELVLAELRKIARQGWPVSRWCERDGEAAWRAYWEVGMEMGEEC